MGGGVLAAPGGVLGDRAGLGDLPPGVLAAGARGLGRETRAGAVGLPGGGERRIGGGADRHPGDGIADLGDRKLVSLSLWETRKDADASVPVAERWVREHLANKVELKSTQIGDMAFFEGTPAKV